MQMQSGSELAARLVDAVTPWLEYDEDGVLCMALGTEASRGIITALLEVAAQKQCVLPTGLAEDLSNWRRPRCTARDSVLRSGFASSGISRPFSMSRVQAARPSHHPCTEASTPMAIGHLASSPAAQAARETAETPKGPHEPHL